MQSLYFTEAELTCRCGCGKCDMDGEFMKRIDALRVAFNSPLKVDSGFRCPTWNAKKGGEPHSYHLRGRAIDFYIVDSAKRYRLVALAQSLGFKGIGVDKQFIHIDDRYDTPVMWVYPISKPA